MSSKYCPNCGHKLEYENMEICPNCETELVGKSSPLKETGTDGNKGLKTFLLIILILAIIAVIAFFISSAISSPKPDSLSEKNFPTHQTTVFTTTKTPLPTTSPPELSCNIAGKWIQTSYENTPVTGVFIQLYSDKRIEIYLNNQLRSWGGYEIIAPNKIRHTWSGGVDTGTGDIITISSDCQTLDVVSFRGEHSTFVKT